MSARGNGRGQRVLPDASLGRVPVARRSERRRDVEPLRAYRRRSKADPGGTSGRVAPRVNAPEHGGIIGDMHAPMSPEGLLEFETRERERSKVLTAATVTDVERAQWIRIVDAARAGTTAVMRERDEALAKLGRVTAQRDRLREYTAHRATCDWFQCDVCTCGLDAALKGEP